LLKNQFSAALSRFASNRFVRQQQRNEIMKQFLFCVKSLFSTFRSTASLFPLHKTNVGFVLGKEAKL